MIPEKLDLEVVTPERRVLAETVDSVVIPGGEGYLGVLPGHAPLLTHLQAGELSYNRSGKTYYLAVTGGYVEVLRDRVRVLADACERPEEIDADRARRSREKAESVLGTKDSSESDFRRAESRLRRAVVRLKVRDRAGV